MLKPKLEKLLKEWVDQNLIDQEQFEKILHFESKSDRSPLNWVLPGFLMLAVTIIAIGLISLIAANWAFISAPLKLTVDFLMLLSLAFGGHWAWKQGRHLLFEVLLGLYLLFILASIGLISQIFHTGGEFYQALMLWSVITIGLATASQRTFVPFLWVSGFLFSLFGTLWNSPFFIAFFAPHRFFLFLLLPLFTFLVTLLFKTAQGLYRSFLFWTPLSVLISLLILDISNFKVDPLMWPRPLFPAYLLGLLCAWGIRKNQGLHQLQMGLLGLMLLTFIGAFHLPLFVPHYMGAGMGKAIYATVTLVLLGMASLLSVSFRQRKLFHLFLFFMTIRFLVLYFQALGGLALTGQGLILSGLLIMAITLLWNKYRVSLTGRLEKFFGSGHHDQVK